jgi:hypothetical protein
MWRRRCSTAGRWWGPTDRDPQKKSARRSQCAARKLPARGPGSQNQSDWKINRRLLPSSTTSSLFWWLVLVKRDAERVLKGLCRLGRIVIAVLEEVTLSDDDVRRLSILGRPCVPQQDPVVPVRYGQEGAIRGHCPRERQRVPVGPVQGRRIEVWLPQHAAGFLSAPESADVVPEKHAAVVGVGHRQADAVAPHAMGTPQRAPRGSAAARVRTALGEIGLAQDHVRVLSLLQCSGNAVPDQDPGVAGVGHDQLAARRDVRRLGRVEAEFVAVGVLGVEIRLADHHRGPGAAVHGHGLIDHHAVRSGVGDRHLSRAHGDRPRRRIAVRLARGPAAEDVGLAQRERCLRVQRFGHLWQHQHPPVGRIRDEHLAVVGHRDTGGIEQRERVRRKRTAVRIAASERVLSENDRGGGKVLQAGEYRREARSRQRICGAGQWIAGQRIPGQAVTAPAPTCGERQGQAED